MDEDVKPNDEGMSRRDFLKGTAAGVGLVAADSLHIPGTTQKEQEGKKEHVGIIEGMNTPTKAIDQLIEHIYEVGVEDGEFLHEFIETYSLEHSSSPEMAARNREVLDYAFGERKLGERIVNAVNDELAIDYPDEEKEARLKHSSRGENQTLQVVVATFSSMELYSGVDIGENDGRAILENLNQILKWVRPMSELQDYEAEKAVYSHRAVDLNEKNRIYDNTYKAWESEGEGLSEAMVAMLQIEEKYFPIANAGIGSIKPGAKGYHERKAGGEVVAATKEPYDNTKDTFVEAIVVGRNGLAMAVEDHDPLGYEQTMSALVHEQGHQFERRALDFNLIDVIHPEDLVEKYETENQMLSDFRDKVVEMSAEDINAFVFDPGLNLKFSEIQLIETKGYADVALQEMNEVRDVLVYIAKNGDDFVREVGMEYFFVRDGKPFYAPIIGTDAFFPEVQDSLVTMLKREVRSPSDSNTREAIMDLHSLGVFATYSLLTKMYKKGTLPDYPDLERKYFNIRRIVEPQILHATQGPPGQYLAPENNPNMRVKPEKAMEQIKAEVADLRKNYPESTEVSVQMMEFLYDQVPKRMDLQARMWGGKGNQDYVDFANEVIDSLT